MKTLLLLRHAKSSHKDESLDDFDRPLNKRGQRDAPRVGSLLADEGLLPDLIVSSTARRTRETVDGVVASAGYFGPTTYLDELYLATPEEYLQALTAIPGDPGRVMVVGHNPGLERLLAAFTGASEPLPTGALAQVALDIDQWCDLPRHPRGRLKNLWRPRELD